MRLVQPDESALPGCWGNVRTRSHCGGGGLRERFAEPLFPSLLYVICTYSSGLWEVQRFDTRELSCVSTVRDVKKYAWLQEHRRVTP